ncbi:MAG: dihydroorotate dehydrogenase [Actinobacteria bacterium]|nr:MAG: dihydroorotate dehydrogenase [Actinomycetota bacterium]
MDISIDLAGIKLNNPVIAAAGTFGNSDEYGQLVNISLLGAVTTKGLSIEPWKGNPYPRMVETVGGLINSVGLQNKGVKDFIADDLPLLRALDAKVIVNIVGKTIEEYAQVASVLDNEVGVDAVEVNISCPNIKKGGSSFGTDPKIAAQVVAAVKKKTKKVVIAKLTPNVTDVSEVAKQVELAGADAISLINTVKAMSVDADTRQSKLATLYGGLSGPAVKPIALRMVHEVSQTVKVPIIGMGGISNTKDALEFIIAGAQAVAVGTATFNNPQTMINIINDIKDYLKDNDLTLKKLSGSLKSN